MRAASDAALQSGALTFEEFHTFGGTDVQQTAVWPADTEQAMWK